MFRFMFSGILFVLFTTMLMSQSSDREYYQIKIYTFDTPEQQMVTDQYLKNAYLPALHKLGIDQVGVFKTRPGENEGPDKTFVLTPLQELSQLEKINDFISQDKSFKMAGKEYIQAAHDNPPYHRIESILLRAFENMPHMVPSPVSGPRKDRIYELRSYEASTEALHENKVEMFNKGGEIKIFEDLGFNAVFYGQVLAGCKMPNLMYMTTFKDQKSRDEHWDAFRVSPEWLALKNKVPYQNNVSGSDKYFLYPTEYSDY